MGPAFDTAAVAMDFYLRLHAERAPDFFVTAEGRDAHICRRMDDHLILTTYREVLESENRKVVPLSIHIENEIPIGKGCGSSACARLAGIALAVHYGHLRWKADRIIGEASMREHHPDNASACWMGGITVARMANQVQAQVVEVKPKGRWPLLLAIPDAPPPSRRAVFCHFNIRARMLSPTFRIPCCCWHRLSTIVRIFFRQPLKTVSINPIARHSVRCCLQSRS
jgi:homoserine kinase